MINVDPASADLATIVVDSSGQLSIEARYYRITSKLIASSWFNRSVRCLS